MGKKNREEPARVLTRAERLMAERLAESRRRAAEWEATLDPRERETLNPQPQQV